MFGFGKNKDDGPISPPVKGSWEFNFNKELMQAVKRRDKINIRLEEESNSRKTSTDSVTSYDSAVSTVSNYSLGPPTTFHTPIQSPSQMIPQTPQFSYFPAKNPSSISPPKLSAPSVPNITKTPKDSFTSSAVDGNKSKTLPSDVNLRVENEHAGGNRESLALDRRGQSVLNMALMFSNLIEDDPSKVLRKRSTTVSTAQTDINSSKLFHEIVGIRSLYYLII